ncbi:MAG: hypothetical protein BWY75_01061 [bacterium ADurb.Bin425]|nr:MAG: hypothetical protein BWY75_01061 [bacterium ADurb.Bin425]
MGFENAPKRTRGRTIIFTEMKTGNTLFDWDLAFYLGDILRGLAKGYKHVGGIGVVDGQKAQFST